MALRLRHLAQITGLVSFCFIFFLFNPGCKYFKSQVNTRFDGMTLLQRVQSAFEGNKEMNDSLGGLFDFTLPQVKGYNTLTIDSLLINKTKRYFYVLIEFPNPIYNRFAVYDSNGYARFIDKSLNGYLKVLKYDDAQAPMLTVTEKFKAKDVIALERLSFYSFWKDTITLALRTFISYNDSSTIMQQSFSAFSHNQLDAQISSNITKGKLKEPVEAHYLYDSTKGKFIAGSNSFDDSILGMILLKKGDYSQYQIIDRKSAIQSFAEKPSIDSVHDYNNAKDKKAGFSLSLPPEGWRIQKNVYLSAQLRKPMLGTLYSNETQGAKISVLELKENEVAENYLNYSLDQEVKKFYTVRFTDKIEIHRLYFRFFEISCLTKKYLVIFEAPKASYQKFQQAYEHIINSFAVDC